MSTVACPDCGQQISPKATACPSCGRPQKAKRGCAPALLATLVVLALAFWWISTGLPQQASNTMVQIKNQVADDAVAQYRIAAREGDHMQMCVQAGMVTAALLQAQDSTHYDQWKATERSDCRRAGVRR